MRRSEGHTDGAVSSTAVSNKSEQHSSDQQTVVSSCAEGCAVRTHDHESEETSLRPKSARVDAHPAAQLYRAAATGRTDVLDSAGILGLQRAVGNSGVGAMLDDQRSPVHDVVNSGGGSPLAPDVREEMQGRLGHDFSDVRVHTDSQAHESAQSVNAHAYTVGSNVVFQRDKYDPGSAAG